MSHSLHQQIRQNFEKKSTLELKRVLAERDSGNWSDDAIEIAEALLGQRQQEPLVDMPIEGSDSGDHPGQSPFELTPAEVATYRAKIRCFGWLLCIMAVVATAVFFVPMMGGDINRFSIVFGILGILLGLYIAFTGVGLIRLDPRSRRDGIVLSAILVLFFPIGTLIGLFGLLWLGKRGSVMTTAPVQPSTSADPAGDEQTASGSEAK